jgi:hypothetical protein
VIYCACNSSFLWNYNKNVLQSGVAHFHAIYNEYNGVFQIDTLEMLEGDLPLRAQKLIKEWATMYRNELKKMWDEQIFIQLPGLE